jgi:hypothetical protein
MRELAKREKKALSQKGEVPPEGVQLVPEHVAAFFAFGAA